MVALLGPRQSGKTTLSRAYFKNHRLVSFEDPAIRDFALTDPRRFLADVENGHGIILDEFQHVPQLLSYIQLEVDERKRRPGYFVLTGSQNFLMNQAITQSLAGCVDIATLLPLSLHELQRNRLIGSNTIDTILLEGSYPRLFAEGLDQGDFYSAYHHTYVEKDVRQLTNVPDLNSFRKFLALCAARIGQLLNLSDLAANCGISVPTAQRWIFILEASYIIFLLHPHTKNFNKRLTKAPKLFFFDTGLACNLLEISSSRMVSLSPFRGHLFENLIVSDLYKQFSNLGRRPPLSFWRDRNGRIEVDCIIDYGGKLIPIEIKSSETVSSDFFKGIEQWNSLSQTDPADNLIIYAGTTKQSRSNGSILSWKDSSDLVKKHMKLDNE